MIGEATYSLCEFKVDEAAREIALRRSVLPECLHVPIAAVDEAAITDFIGEIVEVVRPGSPNKALKVRSKPPAPRDPRYPIWNDPRSALFHEPMQVWVHVDYNGYRRAYKRAMPTENIDGLVLSHCMNRRHAALKEFQYVRILPAGRVPNSSSRTSEDWGIKVFSAPRELESFRKRGVRIHYADLADLMVILDMSPGGGFMEAVNKAQKLVTLSR